MASPGINPRRVLPEEFQQDLFATFSPGTADRILRGMTQQRPTTVRANPLKVASAKLAERFREEKIRFQRVPWYGDAFILEDARERRLEKMPEYDAGALYIQGLASMLPPVMLAPQPGERLLDIAAAPGSKTTQLAALMENSGSIVANEIDKQRAERLRFNVARQGATCVDVRLGRGEKLGDQMPGEFDRVLLDAPCSGEGRFSADDPVTFKEWSRAGVAKLARLQMQLMESGLKALKPGGMLLYATCTLNKAENEAIVAHAITAFGAELVPLPFEPPECQAAFSVDGVALKHARRVLPGRQIEGFFVALLKKR